METKRKKIESLVESHPTLHKVSKFLAEKHNVDEKTIHEKLIDFLEDNCSMVDEDRIYGIKCFVFDKRNMKFINKTIYEYRFN